MQQQLQHTRTHTPAAFQTVNKTTWCVCVCVYVCVSGSSVIQRVGGSIPASGERKLYKIKASDWSRSRTTHTHTHCSVNINIYFSIQFSTRPPSQVALLNNGWISTTTLNWKRMNLCLYIYVLVGMQCCCFLNRPENNEMMSQQKQQDDKTYH